MPVDPFKETGTTPKTVIHDPMNFNMFDDKATKLEKRKNELLKNGLYSLTPQEQAELKEIDKQLEKIKNDPSTKKLF